MAEVYTGGNYPHTAMQTAMTATTSGNTASRPVPLPSKLAFYYDTTLGRLLTAVSGQWVFVGNNETETGGDYPPYLERFFQGMTSGPTSARPTPIAPLMFFFDRSLNKIVYTRGTTWATLDQPAT